MRLFQLRGVLPARIQAILELSGILLLFLVWVLLTAGADPLVPKGILPSPSRVWNALHELFVENDLLTNIFRSIGLNFSGYLEAILISIFFGFLIGLFPLFRGLFNRPIDALRFVPLTGVIGLFITWWGLGTAMKVHFLAFGILIYMLPVIIRRIDDVEEVYLKTAYTLGASDFQTVRTVYWPHVMSKFSDDIRVLTAISWTYIIIIEGIGSQGGLGSLMWKSGIRQGNIDKLFAMLFVIVIIGFLQDKFFVWLDKKMFPYKYQSLLNKNAGLLTVSNAMQKGMTYFGLFIRLSVSGLFIILLINEYTGILGKKDLLHNAFAETYPVIAILMLLFAFWLLSDFILPNQKRNWSFQLKNQDGKSN